MHLLKRLILAAFELAENALDALLGPRLNPLAQLGAFGWFLFWLIAASGIYLYVFFDTGVTQAYASIESITHDQWWAGGLFRSLHRYASDGLVVVTVLHLLREFGKDRIRGKRWFAWISGLVLIVFIYVCGITGYWMVWDQLAQYVAATTSAWLDALPIFAQPISRNFLSSAELSGRFFTLMVYMHIAAPLAMLMFMWIHIQGYNHARVNPPRPLMLATVLVFLALSLVVPAVSQAPANLDELAQSVGLDWFYLAAYPLIEPLGAVGLWWLVLAAFALLAMLPWLPRQRSAPVALVHLDNCNGCARCFDDCPFGAITMQPRSDGLPFSEEAVVDSDACLSCGICVGACPTATPFRRATALIPGIELPEFSLAALRDRIEGQSRAAGAGPGALVFRCQHSAFVAPPAGTATAIIEVPCVGMVPPSFIDLAVKRGLASGAMLAGCRESDCYQRLGISWTEQRIAGERDPYLRDRVPRDRVAVSWAGPGQQASRARDLMVFGAALGSPTTDAGHVTAAGRNPWRRTQQKWASRPLRYAVLTTLVAAAAASVGLLSTSPTIRLRGADEAVITLSLSHAGRLRQECRQLTPDELAKLEPNMRRPTDCSRGRWPVYLELELGQRRIYAGSRSPAGLWEDGPSSLFERFRVPAGRQQLTVRMRDTGRATGFDYQGSADVDLRPGQSLVVGFQQPGLFSFK